MWQPEAKAKVRELWEDGKSASEIANTLSNQHQHYTRNMVIGVVHRMKLPHHDAPVPKRHLPYRPKPQPLPRRVPTRSKVRAEPRPLEHIDAEYHGKPKSVLDIGFHECHFPVIGNGTTAQPYLYCAAPAKVGMYCERHAAKMKQ